MEIKYTTDGKKVVVVGKLNNTESIIQEIFVARINDADNEKEVSSKAIETGLAQETLDNEK